MSSSSSESVTPGQNRSFPFTISAILSDELGQKKSPPASLNAAFTTPVSNINSNKVPSYSTSSQASHRSSGTPKRPRKSSSSYVSARAPKISHSETGMMVAPGCQTYTNRPSEVLRGGHTATYYTPYKPLSSQVNTSHISPFNTNVLLALGQHPSPSSDEREELFGETSLGMLSEVAQYHGELSGMDPNSTTETTMHMHEQFANIRLLSGCDEVEPSTGDARNPSLNGRGRKSLTPSILKRDKKRRRVSSGGSACPSSSGDESTSSKYSQFHHNTGFLSPLANEKSNLNKELGFSPSIFLSRPDNSHTTQSSTSSPPSSAPIPIPSIQLSSSSPPSSAPIPIPRPDCSTNNAMDLDHRETSSHLENFRPGGSSVGYDRDPCARGVGAVPDQLKSRECFMTSTPIKSDKENLRKRRGSMEYEEEGSWSPTILHSSGRKHLRESNDSSSGSEFEAIKKPCLLTPTQKQHQQQSRRKSKARTKLSPLLENSCSPISKDTHLPSPLTTALATIPVMPFNMISQASSSPLPHLPPPPAYSTAHTSFSTAQSSLPLLLPPHHTSLLGTRVLSSTAVGSTGSLVRTQPLLGGSTPTTIPHTTLHYKPFPTGPGILKPQQQLQQVTTPHALQTQLLRPISIPHLHPSSLPFNPPSSLPFNPLAACNPQPLQSYNNANVIRNVIPPPGYMPLVNLVTTPTPAMASPSYLYAPYHAHTPPMVPLDRSTEGKMTLQSVPPWFIFSNNRSEKRSRLTEAINKSLTETPSQPSKLPVEWTKLACGQTKDQKMLTERARMFLHFCPRQLTFNDDAD